MLLILLFLVPTDYDATCLSMPALLEDNKNILTS